MANEHSQIVPSMQPTAKVADFKFWCQKVLPLVYDDSLSYYEVLNKMVVYLNQVIDNINADIDNVEELKDDFLLLQTYVNNFFDDIDQLVTYTERAEAAQTAAASSAISAASSASNAATSAVNAASSSGSAATSALSALDAKDAAVAAKTAAEAALASAQSAAVNAANSATAAGNSASAASGSAVNAAASAASALQNFQLSDAARQAAEQAAEDAETAAELIDMDATPNDVGKAIIVKTVGGGKVTAYEFGESGGGGGGTGGIVNTIENVPVASFDDGTDAPVVELVVAVNPVQSGSGDPSPVNERPISGWTGANVMSTGKNLLPNQTGSYVEKTSDLLYFTPTGGITLPAGTYYVGVYRQETDSATTGIYLKVGSATATRLGSNTGSQYAVRSFELSEESVVTLYLSSSASTGNHYRFMLTTAVLTEGENQFEASTGTAYPITFPVEAGTVYGATIDLVRWKLIVYMVSETFIWSNGTNSTDLGNNIRKRFTLSNESIATTDVSKMLCSVAPINRSYTNDIVHAYSDPQYAFVFLPEDTDSNLEFQYVYQLATPIEYNLTAQQINTLLGSNNIWADTGNINLLKYIANGKQYVDEKDSLVKALIAKELSSMIADTALVANDFRIVNNTLYKITGNIASGGTLTPGTNCVATTIGEVLKTLLT